MLSIHNIIDQINVALQEMVDCDLPDVNVGLHGVAVSQLRDSNKEIIPASLTRQGEGEYVGIDDLFAVRLYHKVNGISCSLLTKSVGRSQGEQVNSYSVAIIVFLNRLRTAFFPDEIVQLIQAWFPDTIKLDPYSSIKIVFNNVVLSDLQVYNQEYKTQTYRLLPEYNLFQINYTVETTFRKGCFKNCPEGSYY